MNLDVRKQRGEIVCGDWGGDKQTREGNETLKMLEQSFKSLLENQDCLNYME